MIFAEWYEDRSFPEIKESNAKIISVVEDPGGRRLLIAEHNRAVRMIHALQNALRESHMVLQHAITLEHYTPGGSTEGMAKDAVKAAEEIMPELKF